MPTHGGRGFYEWFRDFDETVVADVPELEALAVGATGVTEIVAGAANGVVGIGVDTSNDNDVAAVGSNLVWYANDNGTLIGEARVRWSSVTDMHWFIGFAEVAAGLDEVTFDSTTTDVYDIITPTDGVGFVFNNDAATPRVVCVAGKTNAVTFQALLPARFTPVIDTWYVFRVEIGPGATYIEWSIDGETVCLERRASGVTTSYVNTAIAMKLGVWNYEQATANIIYCDYMFGRKGRSSGLSA